MTGKCGHHHHPVPVRHHPVQPNGFALMMVMWFMLLGAVLVAVLMKNAGNLSADSRQLIQQKQAMLAQESAIDRIIADILFNSRQSRYYQLPAQDTLMIDGQRVDVQLVSENGKVDVMRADPAMVERALHGLGVPANMRESLTEQLEISRKYEDEAAGHMRALGIFRGIQGDLPDDFCMAQWFTRHSGLATPQKTMMDDALAKALAIPQATAGNMGGGTFSAGMAITFTVRTDNSPPLRATIRIIGQINHSHDIIDWRYGNLCGL